ncbi:MAG: peptidyl-prolyl cis-trans isomerase [Hespellia sp.]|nr:peptidyl-prolyl cis-trans isomerase [Hespellia sp.]
MKHLNRKFVVVAAVVLAMTSLGGCGKLKDTDIVATVGKDEISAGVANFYARLQQAQSETYYASYMGDDMWATEVEKGTTFEDSVKKSTLEGLEDMYLLKQHVSDYEIELTDEEKAKIEKAADDFVEANTLENKAVVSGEKKYVQEVLELMTIQNKMNAAMKTGVDEEVSDEEAAQKSMQYVLFSYSSTDESGNAVTMSDDEKAAQLQAAKDFFAGIPDGDLSAAAAAAGIEVQTATFDSDSTSPDADVIAAADAVEAEGGVTDVIDTDNGAYICKVTSFLDRGATDSKKGEIVEQRKTDQYDSLLKGYRDDTDISVNKKNWKKISFVDQGVTMKQETEEPYATGADGTSTSNDDESESE